MKELMKSEAPKNGTVELTLSYEEVYALYMCLGYCLCDLTESQFSVSSMMSRENGEVLAEALGKVIDALPEDAFQNRS
jgi:hypothetical protein